MPCVGELIVFGEIAYMFNEGALVLEGVTLA